MLRLRLPFVPLFVALMVAAACSPNDQRTDAATTPARSESVVTERPASQPSTEVGAGEPTATTVTTSSTTAVVSPSTTTAVSPSTSPADSMDFGVDTDAVEAEFDDDPIFELGPDVVLDVDLARFPPDDAGIGAEPDPSASTTAPGNVEIAVDGPAGWAGFDASLAAALDRPGNTAASVAVSINGDLVHRAAFGERDPATGDPAEPQDRFRIASISKPITAIVALQLVDQGLVGLDDPVGALVAEHIGVDPGSTGNLTLRRLLTHRTGFGKYQSTFFRAGADDCTDAARQGLGRGASGGGYVYSNVNYCIAGLAIEAITGLSYERAVYQYLLTPLGISGMRLAPTVDPGPDEIQHVTTPGRNYMETLGGAGGWVATPADLVTIFDSLNTSTPGFAPLPTNTVLAMFTPAGARFGQRGYGLGVISYGNGRYGHTGTIESTHAMVLDRGDGVVWALTVAGQWPGESTDIERLVNQAFAAGGFVST